MCDAPVITMVTRKVTTMTSLWGVRKNRCNILDLGLEINSHYDFFFVFKNSPRSQVDMLIYFNWKIYTKFCTRTSKDMGNSNLNMVSLSAWDTLTSLKTELWNSEEHQKGHWINESFWCWWCKGRSKAIFPWASSAQFFPMQFDQ